MPGPFTYEVRCNRCSDPSANVPHRGACGDADGNFYFADLPRGAVYRIAADAGAPELWFENAPRISGMKFGPDGEFQVLVKSFGELDLELDGFEEFLDLSKAVGNDILRGEIAAPILDP